jgi:hypothetical protein
MVAGKIKQKREEMLRRPAPRGYIIQNSADWIGLINFNMHFLNCGKPCDGATVGVGKKVGL